MKIQTNIKETIIVSSLSKIFKTITKPINDETYLKMAFKMRMHKSLDLNNTATFNEKIQWLKLNNRDPMLNIYVDKYAVKDVVAEVIGEEYIIPTLGAWEKFEDIDFSSLPKQFVLKCNHDSHSVVICKDKEELDYKSAKKILQTGLKTNYFWHGREWAYKDVKPLIIAEKYLTDDNDTEELTDYKFYCFKDYVDSMMICYDRDSGDPKYYFFDKNWELKKYNKRGIEALEGFSLSKPKNVDKMFELASRLSATTAAPFVRVDLYNVNGQPYFGELTFSPNNGLDQNFLPQADQYFGDLIDLSVVKTKMRRYVCTQQSD